MDKSIEVICSVHQHLPVVAAEAKPALGPPWVRDKEAKSFLQSPLRRGRSGQWSRPKDERRWQYGREVEEQWR
jgi:hypothetical protein